MSGPTFVNNGAFKQSVASSISPALPGSRTNGNLLLAFGKVAGSGAFTVSVSGSGWTTFTGGSINQGGAKAQLFAYRYVDGTEAAPTFSIASAAVLDAVVCQYTGVVGSSPIGAHNSNSSGGAQTTLTCNGVTSTANNSLAVIFECATGGSGAPGTPSGWSSETSDTTTDEYRVADLAIASSGTSSGNASVTYTSSTYTAFIFEILSTAPSTSVTVFKKLKQYLRR